MKRLLKLLAVPVLSLSLLAGLNSCKTSGKIDKGEIDVYDALPENVRGYEGDIDVLIYIEGQQGTMLDIGHKDYTYKDIFDAYLARFYASAKEFNRFAPKARINIQYCSIKEYNNVLQQYMDQHGHIPHIMHSINILNTIRDGYATDLSIYSDSKYYKVFDESIMKEFNFGGFQGAIPYMIYPMGLFVNTRLVESAYIEYDEDYVENFTMEKFFETLQATTTNEVAGMSQPVEWILSLSAPSVYQSYVYNQKMNLLDPVVNDLLEYENRLVDYSAYTITPDGWKAKESYNVQPWAGLNNFVVDEAYTFSAEMPWNIGNVHARAEAANKKQNIDLLPYPKANEETNAHVGMLSEGLVIGNQCPISKGECSQESMNARDAAAYFTMFMNADPRAIRAKSEIVYSDTESSNQYVGVMDLPMVKKNYTYNWGEDAVGDKDYVTEEIFSYQMELYLQNYTTYWYKENADDRPDVKNYSNVKPGFKKVLEIFYDNPHDRICFYGRPNTIPAPTAAGTRNILAEWEGRMFGDKTILLGSPTYVGWVRGNLSIWQNEINANIQTCYELFKERMAAYYGEGKYWK